MTDQCNLDCSYCSEYDNRVAHPELAHPLRYADKARELGCLHMGLQGGEPLLHPDLYAVIRHCRALGMSVSMSTNGFLLEPNVVSELEDAGLETIQVSVDRMTPTLATRKALKTVTRKLVWLRGSNMKVQIAGVLFADTLDECRDVLETTLEMGFSSHFRIVHAGPDQELTVPTGDQAELDRFITEMMDRKAAGERIHTTWSILNYQRAVLSGQDLDWTCVAGYKYFFISSRGKFWPCSMLRTDIDFMDVTPELLKQYHVKKDCQSNCGVYCVVSASMITERPFGFALDELLAKRREVPSPGFIEIAEPARA